MRIMSLFNIFKRIKRTEDSAPLKKYWSLTTMVSEVVDPSWQEVETAIKNAFPGETVFASLAQLNAGLEIELLQAAGDNDIYRVEAIPPRESLEHGDIFVNDGLTEEEVLEIFMTFFKHNSVAHYRDWTVEKR